MSEIREDNVVIVTASDEELKAAGCNPLIKSGGEYIVYTNKRDDVIAVSSLHGKHYGWVPPSMIKPAPQSEIRVNNAVTVTASTEELKAAGCHPLIKSGDSYIVYFVNHDGCLAIRLEAPTGGWVHPSMVELAPAGVPVVSPYVAGFNQGELTGCTVIVTASDEELKAAGYDPLVKSGCEYNYTNEGCMSLESSINGLTMHLWIHPSMIELVQPRVPVVSGGKIDDIDYLLTLKRDEEFKPMMSVYNNQQMVNRMHRKSESSPQDVAVTVTASEIKVNNIVTVTASTEELKAEGCHPSIESGCEYNVLDVRHVINAVRLNSRMDGWIHPRMIKLAPAAAASIENQKRKGKMLQAESAAWDATLAVTGLQAAAWGDATNSSSLVTAKWSEYINTLPWFKLSKKRKGKMLLAAHSGIGFTLNDVIIICHPRFDKNKGIYKAIKP